MKPSRKNAARLAVFAAAGVFAVGAAAQRIDDVGQAIGALQAAGYTTVRDVEFDDGLWEAEVKGADGRWHDVHVDPASGSVIDRMSGGALLTAGAVTERLKQTGYTSIHELDLDEAVWDAEAVDAQGQRVEVRVNGFTGAILSSSVDR